MLVRVQPIVRPPWLQQHLERVRVHHRADLRRGPGERRRSGCAGREVGYDIRTIQELLGHKDGRHHNDLHPRPQPRPQRRPQPTHRP